MCTLNNKKKAKPENITFNGITYQNVIVFTRDVNQLVYLNTANNKICTINIVNKKSKTKCKERQ
tara:strand:+ start:923 stop:1114 length:192 start_codon:yes stop_codon:yes gene_type:complete